MVDNNSNYQESSEPSDTDDVLASAEKKQREIRDALLKLDPNEIELCKGLASVYEGFVLTSTNKNNPDRIAQASHSARELTAILPRYFQVIPIVEEGLENEETKKKEVQENRQKEILEEMVGRHSERSTLPEYLRKKFVDGWMDVQNYFHVASKHSDLKKRKYTGVDNKKFEAFVWKYEDLLHQLLVEKPFFEGITNLDNLLNVETPSDRDLSDLATFIEQPEHNRYFFQNCTNPNWLEPLTSIGAFKHPQEPLREGGYIRFLVWPESQYLAKIAKDKPQEVFDIVKTLDTDNQSVLNDFMDAALNSPPDVAKQYVNLICKKKWIQNQYNALLPEKIAKLMVKLVDAGNTADGLRLARILFDTRILPQAHTAKGNEDSLITSHPEAKPYFSDWMFGEIAEKYTKELGSRDPKALFTVFTSKLRQSLELENRASTDEGYYEYSHIWRPNIQSARLINREDAKNVLLDSIITLIDASKDDKEVLEDFVSNLKKHPYGMFRRIEMYLYKVAEPDFIKDSEEILKNEEIIFAYNLRREYLPLLGKMFDKVSENAQLEILKAIKKGPDFNKPSDFTDEQYIHAQDGWRNQYYTPIKDSLPKEYFAKYKTIVDKYGEPVEDTGEMITWDGGRSPLSKEELATMSAENTVQYFADYKTPDDPFERHSSNSLGMAFADVVKEDPQKYVSAIPLFKEKKLRPIYFYNLIRGLKESLQSGGQFDWEPVINLCHNLIFQEELRSVPAHQDEQGWRTVRQTIADFLGDALGRGDNNPPISLKERVWSVISELVEDPEPTSEDEKRDGEGGLDPMTLAINTIRGEAMHAVINYGLWVARNLKDKTVEVKIPQEVTDVLDKHLDKNQDPSLAIHSIYGWRTPNIWYLNKPWFVANREKIFPKDSPTYLLAAWEGYLANNVIKEVFKLLRQQSFDFIQHLGTFEKKGFRANDVDQKFPQHIMVAYVSDDENDDLVDYFFKNAPVKARAEALNFAGRVILRSQEDLRDKEQTLKRLGELWEKRISLSPKETDVEELMELGWWLKFSPVGEKETLELMTKTLERTNGKIDVPYEIVEELIKYVPKYPLESAKLLRLLAKAKQEFHEISYKQKEYREVLQLIKDGDNQEAKKIKDEIINYFGSIGFVDEFRDLL